MTRFQKSIAIQIALPLLFLCGTNSAEAPRIDQSKKFRPDGTFGETDLGRLKDGRDGKFRYESGKYNDVQYRVYFDGSGVFGREIDGIDSWGQRIDVQFSQDEMDDSLTATMVVADLNLVVVISWEQDKEEIEIFVGHNHYPNSTALIRINDEKPYEAVGETGFKGSVVTEIFEKFILKPHVRTRYTEWPNTSPSDGSCELHGFREALEYVRWAKQQIVAK